jgi:membrane protease YdiL (CAAX protease family)
MKGAALRATVQAAAVVVLAALWIGLGPDVAARWTGGQGPGGEALFTLLVFGPLLGAALLGGGLTGAWPLHAGGRIVGMLAFGCALGAFGILVATGYAAMAGTLVKGGPGNARPALLLAGCGVVLLQVLAEEAYFRGWLQPVVARGWGSTSAVVSTALGFALLHVVGGAQDPVSIVNLLLGGLLFGMLAQIGSSIWPAVAAHFAWNAIEQLGLGLDPNPGLGGFGALVNFDLVGAARWGGSDEGLNASFAMSFALLALLMPLVLVQWRAASRTAVTA